MKSECFQIVNSESNRIVPRRRHGGEKNVNGGVESDNGQVSQEVANQAIENIKKGTK